MREAGGVTPRIGRLGVGLAAGLRAEPLFGVGHEHVVKRQRPETRQPILARAAPNCGRKRIAKCLSRLRREDALWAVAIG